MSGNFPYIFTFYSFKGGVGRSMALLNVAYALSGRGRHVLILDMDLEAPGVSGFMRRTGEIEGKTQFDAIDLVAWACSAADLSEDALGDEFIPTQPPFDFTHTSVPLEKRKQRPRYGEVGRIDVIGVDTDRDFFERLTSLDLGSKTRDQLIKSGQSIRDYLKGLRIPLEVPDYYGPDAPRSQPYDYVLIDSRTGTTEIGGLCVGPLSDRMVVFTGLNDQNVYGTKSFLDALGLSKRREDMPEPWDDADPPADETDAPPRLAPKPTILVASPVPYGEIEFKQRRLEETEKTMGQKVATKLSYHPQLALMESIFVRDYPEEPLAEEYRDLTSQVMRLVRDHAEQLVTSALAKSEEKRTTEAIEELLRAVTHRPENSFVLATLATSLEPKTDREFMATDRMYRILREADPPGRYVSINNFTAHMGRWARTTDDRILRQRRLEEVVDGCSTLIEIDQVPNNICASVRFNRALALGRMDPPRIEEAIADYTVVIEITDAPAEQRARALVNRGAAYGTTNPPQNEKAIADYTAVVEMADAPAEQRVMALVNRGTAYGKMNPPQIDKSIAGYTDVINMADAPAEYLAKALYNRGATYGQMDPPQTDKAIADYTAVIELADAPAEHRIMALFNRGSAYGKLEPPQNDAAVADYTAVIEMPDATGENRAKALINRGATYEELDPPQIDKAIADYTAVIEMADVSVKQRAYAHSNLGWLQYRNGQLEESVALARASLEASPTDVFARGNLAVALLCLGQIQDAIGEYKRAANDAREEKFLDDMKEDLREALAKRGPLAGAEDALAVIAQRREELQRGVEKDDGDGDGGTA